MLHARMLQYLSTPRDDEFPYSTRSPDEVAVTLERSCLPPLEMRRVEMTPLALIFVKCLANDEFFKENPKNETFTMAA